MLTFNLKTTFFTVKTSNEVFIVAVYILSTTFKRPYNKKNITRQLKDMDFMFSWQKQYLTRSLGSLFLPLEHKILIFSQPCNILYLLYEYRDLRAVEW